MFCGKKRHCLCHILRLACAACGDALRHAGAHRLRQHGSHVGVDKAGCYRVHGHVPRGQFPGKALGQTDEPRLAGGVVGLPGVAPQRHHAGKVHDAAIALAHHAAGGLLAAEKGAFQVGVQHCVKILLGQAQNQVVPGDARVVHQHIHPAKGLGSGIEQCLTALGGGYIRLHSHRLHALGAAEGCRLLRRLCAVAVIHHHIAALLCQCHAHCAANAPAAAGNNGGAGQLFFAHSASFHAVSTASSCSGVSTAVQTTPGRVFFTKPLRALPGPTSRMWSTPSSPRRRKVSSM